MLLALLCVCRYSVSLFRVACSVCCRCLFVLLCLYANICRVVCDVYCLCVIGVCAVFVFVCVCVRVVCVVLPFVLRLVVCCM